MFPKLPTTFRPGRSGPATLIVVYAEWCGFCKEFMPKLRAMKNKLPARIYQVNGDADPRAQEWGIDGYPTIMYRPMAGGMYRYNGARTYQGIRDFIRTLERGA